MIAGLRDSEAGWLGFEPGLCRRLLGRPWAWVAAVWLCRCGGRSFPSSPAGSKGIVGFKCLLRRARAVGPPWRRPAVGIVVSATVIVVALPAGIGALGLGARTPGAFPGDRGLGLTCVSPASWERTQRAAGEGLGTASGWCGFWWVSLGSSRPPSAPAGPGVLQAPVSCNPRGPPLRGAEATSCLRSRGGGGSFDPLSGRGGHGEVRSLAASRLCAEMGRAAPVPRLNRPPLAGSFQSSGSGEGGVQGTG